MTLNKNTSGKEIYNTRSSYHLLRAREKQIREEKGLILNTEKEIIQTLNLWVKGRAHMT